MFKDEILEMIFSEDEMCTIPIGTQATAVNVFTRVMEKIKEENPYANVSDLFADE